MTEELNDYIKRLNLKNNFDLAWSWTGNGPQASIEVYEEAERHILTIAPVETIFDSIARNLEDWGLEDVSR